MPVVMTPRITRYRRDDVDWGTGKKLAARAFRTVCGELKWSYLREASAKESKYIFISTNTESGKVSGMLLLVKGYGCTMSDGCQSSMDGFWYIAAVCASSGGIELMRAAETTARDEDGRYLQLGALLYVIAYYRNKLGYRLAFVEDETRQVMSAFEAAIGSRRLVDDDAKYLETEQKMRKFVTILTNKGLSISKLEGRPCSSHVSCGVNGYLMTLCLRKKKFRVHNELDGCKRSGYRLFWSEFAAKPSSAKYKGRDRAREAGNEWGRMTVEEQATYS
jgi:hypothetical protein